MKLGRIKCSVAPAYELSTTFYNGASAQATGFTRPPSARTSPHLHPQAERFDASRRLEEGHVPLGLGWHADLSLVDDAKAAKFADHTPLDDYGPALIPDLPARRFRLTIQHPPQTRLKIKNQPATNPGP